MEYPYNVSLSSNCLICNDVGKVPHTVWNILIPNDVACNFAFDEGNYAPIATTMIIRYPGMIIVYVEIMIVILRRGVHCFYEWRIYSSVLFHQQIFWLSLYLFEHCVWSLAILYWFWDWLILIFSFIFNFKPVIFYQILRFLLFASFCIYLVRPWAVSVPHPTWLRIYTDSYARGQGPAIDRETV